MNCPTLQPQTFQPSEAAGSHVRLTFFKHLMTCRPCLCPISGHLTKSLDSRSSAVFLFITVAERLLRCIILFLSIVNFVKHHSIPYLHQPYHASAKPHIKIPSSQSVMCLHVWRLCSFCRGLSFVVTHECKYYCWGFICKPSSHWIMQVKPKNCPSCLRCSRYVNWPSRSGKDHRQLRRVRSNLT